VRKLGFLNAFSAKFQAGKLTIIRDEGQVTGKTRDLEAVVAKLGWPSVLIVAGETIPGFFTFLLDFCCITNPGGLHCACLTPSRFNARFQFLLFFFF
jgi:hypothetical protein